MSDSHSSGGHHADVPKDQQLEGEVAIRVRNLNFSFSTSDGRKKPVLHDINLEVQHGSRLLLIGPNGAGKVRWLYLTIDRFNHQTNIHRNKQSTLLRLLAGKNLTDDRDSIQVLGKPAFFQTLGVSGVSFLGNSMWSRPVAFVGSAVAYEADIAAGDMMSDLQAQFRERRDKLVELLDIDLSWRLNQVSDGQRRRIQIMLGLLQPFRVLLIDEFTVDLDVLARRDLLNYLKQEADERGCTILYCTHIFDGMDDWPTHSVFMSDGRIRQIVTYPLSSPLYPMVLDFMIQARKEGANKDTQEQLVENFGAQGFSAGRIMPSTQFRRNRMNDYKF